jgi:hypothetical protein
MFNGINVPQTPNSVHASAKENLTAIIGLELCPVR